MTTLVFDPYLAGHHMEYLHHIYSEALRHKEDRFVFCLPRAFDEKKKMYEWADADNIVFELDDEIARRAEGGMLSASWKLSLTIRRLAIKHNAERVVLITLKQPLPFLPFLLPKQTSVCGIMYDVLLYIDSFSKRIRAKAICLLCALHPQIESVFVLNDQTAAGRLNDMFHSQKFTYLPDPMKDIDRSKLRNVRAELTATETDKVFLHFGALDGRKGTKRILDALERMQPEELTDKVFVFAGNVSKTMQKEFAERIAALKGKTRIVVHEGYCENELLNNLCYSCDFILMPYLQSYRSSGVVGYASYFRKPAIGPGDGLVGQLIKDNNLGVTIDNVDGEHIANAIMQLAENGFPTQDMGAYAESHTVDAFNEVIFKRY